jgi:hypothetical protein
VGVDIVQDKNLIDLQDQIHVYMCFVFNYMHTYVHLDYVHTFVTPGEDTISGCGQTCTLTLSEFTIENIANFSEDFETRQKLKYIAINEVWKKKNKKTDSYFHCNSGNPPVAGFDMGSSGLN